MEACTLLTAFKCSLPSIKSLPRQGTGGVCCFLGQVSLHLKCDGLTLSLPSLQDEKEQLNEYKGHLSGLAKRAKAIVQLKPRNPAYPVRGHVPLLAVCDYKQVEVRAGLGCAQARWDGLARA